MTATATQFTIEEVGPCRKKISITIPPEQVREQLGESLEALSHEAALPGFRKGRAPKHLIEKRFGKNVREEARNRAVAAAYQQAIDEHKLQVLGDPEGGDELKDLEIDENTTIEFAVEVDIAPEFDTPDVSGVEIMKPMIEVTDEMVDDQIARLAQNNGELEHQDDAQPGDYYIGHGVMTVKGEDEPVVDIQDAVIQIPAADSDGKGAILGVMVDDFAKQLGLPKVGDTATVKVKGPDNHENPKVRGADLTITFEPTRIERIVPASVDTLVQMYGLADEKQFRETLMLQLNRRALIDQQAAMRQQVSRHLVETVEFDLPERLTTAQAARNIERARMELAYRGLDPAAVEDRLAEMRASSDESAVRQLKLFFIVAKVAQEKEVQVTEGEVAGRIAQIAAERGVRADQLRDEIIQRGQGQVIVNQIREHKVLDALVSQAKIKELPVDEYNEKVRAERDTEV